MSIGPILYDDRVIVGPLRVAPINYPDGVGGTPINDPTWATRDKDYVAFVDDEAGGQNVGFAKTSPFWSFNPTTPADNNQKLINIEYWNCGKLQAEIVSPATPWNVSGIRAQCVDGNGHLYQHWSQPKAPGGINNSVIRIIKRDGSIFDATIDWQSIAPTTMPSGAEYDPFETSVRQGIPYPQFGSSALYYILPQHDGVLVQCQVRAIVDPEPVFPVVETGLMWVRVSESGSVGVPWWQPVADIPDVGTRQAYAYCPLREGYIGTDNAGGATGVLFRVDANGVITHSESVPFTTPTGTFNGALSSSSLGSPSHTAQIHSNESFWLRGQDVQPGPYLLDANLNDITPQWAKDINSQLASFMVTATPPSNAEFRMLSIEFEAGQSFHRVRDRFGNVVSELQRNSLLGMDDYLYGLRVHADCFIFEREGPPFGAYGFENNGLYKFRSDNTIGVPIARNRAGCWSREEFPHLGYLDWPFSEEPTP